MRIWQLAVSKRGLVMRRDGYKIFSEGRIGNLTLPNRLVRSATWDPSILGIRKMTDEVLNLYRELAAGRRWADHHGRLARSTSQARPAKRAGRGGQNLSTISAWRGSSGWPMSFTAPGRAAKSWRNWKRVTWMPGLRLSLLHFRAQRSGRLPSPRFGRSLTALSKPSSE